jgi:hypothetical protein
MSLSFFLILWQVFGFCFTLFSFLISLPSLPSLPSRPLGLYDGVSVNVVVSKTSSGFSAPNIFSG